MVFETNLDSVPASLHEAPDQAKCPVCGTLADIGISSGPNRFSYDCGCGGEGKDAEKYDLRFYVTYSEENGKIFGAYNGREVIPV